MNRLMKIHETPIATHNKLLTTKHKHISQTNNGYTIRITKNGTTYYYGEYKSIQEAQKIEYKLQLQKYPTRLSKKNTTQRGEQYKIWLQKELEKE